MRTFVPSGIDFVSNRQGNLTKSDAIIAVYEQKIILAVIQLKNKIVFLIRSPKICAKVFF